MNRQPFIHAGASGKVGAVRPLSRAATVAVLAAFAVAVLLLGACSTPRERFDKAFANGDCQKAYATSAAAATAAADDLEWQLLAATGAQLSGHPDAALAAYVRAGELFRQIDAVRAALADDSQRRATALLAPPTAAPFAAAVHERIMASTYRAIVQLELRNIPAARAALNEARMWREIAVARFPVESAAIEQSLAAILARYAPDTGDLARYISTKRFLETPVNDSAFRGYGDYVNPFAIYLGAIVALFDRDSAAAVEGLKATATVLPNNRQVAAEAAYFAKHTEVSDRVCVIIENGLISRLHEARFDIKSPFPAPASSSEGGGAKKTAAPPLERLEFAFPMLEPVSSSHTGFRVNVPGREAPFYSEVLANMDSVIRAEYNRHLPVSNGIESVRTVLRATFHRNPVEDAPKISAPVADTRQWSALPKDVHLITFNMPPERSFSLSSTHSTHTIPVKIPPCRSAIVFLRVPGSLADAPAPRIVTFD